MAVARVTEIIASSKKSFDDAIKEGLVAPTHRYYEVAYTQCPGSLRFSAPELEEIQNEISRSFQRKRFHRMFNPIRAVRELYPRVRSWRDLRYILRLARWSLSKRVLRQ